MNKIEKIERELDEISATSSMPRTRLLVIIAKLLLIIVQQGSVM